MNIEVTYGGFWRRVGAFLADALIFLPLSLAALWLNGRYRLFSLYYFGPGILIGLFYSVYLVKRFGGTPGKVVAGLRIIRVDGSPIGYREAVIRFFPEFFLSLIMSVGIIQATLQMSDLEYASFGFLERNVRVMALVPVWFKPVQYLNNAWVFSEFIVLLTNKKRRALHDFIAGTVVVLRNQEPIAAPPALPVAAEP
jgi:uncharacterized RDD family membrane protein YckC